MEKLRINIIIFIFLGMAAAAKAESGRCPVIFPASEFHPHLPDLDRSELHLFALKLQPKLEWIPLDLQVDWRDEHGTLLLPDARSERLQKAYEESKARGFSADDRFIFDSNDESARYQLGMSPPCSTGRIYEVKMSDADQYVYFAYCPARKSLLKAEQRKFQFNPDDRFVRAPTYQFTYSKHNHILFDRINVEGIEVGRAADLRIRSDVKRFFTLDFSSKDVESVIDAHRVGKHAFLANLTFYLKILFFKIDLELNTAMAFFSNAVHIPMVLHMPVEANEWLHPASGTFYTWEIDPLFMKLDYSGKELPILEPDQIKAGWQELAKVGLRFCKASECIYWLRGKFGEKSFAMQYIIPKHLVKRGFFPLLTSRAQQSEVALGWRDEDEVDASKNRVGIYFESSGLTKGEHEWEFWIQMGQPAENKSCPRKAIAIQAFEFKPEEASIHSRERKPIN